MVFQTISQFAPLSVDEHLPVGAVVGIFFDPIVDFATPISLTTTRALVAGEGDADNSLFDLEGEQLKLTSPIRIGGFKNFSPIDFENKSSYSIRVRKTQIFVFEDSSSQESVTEEVISLSVTDLADPFSSQSDGKLLWHDRVNNNVIGWELRDNQIFGTQTVSDGVIFDNSLRKSSPTVIPVPYLHNPNSEIVGVGDFGGNGNLALLQRDVNDLSLKVLMLKDGQVDGQIPLEILNPLGQEWKVVGVDDFNGDNHADILWRNQDNGQLLTWYLEEQQVIQYFETGPQLAGSRLGGEQFDLAVAGFTGSDFSNLNLNIEATGDFNGDGNADLIVHDHFSRSVEIWLMDKAEITSVSRLQFETESYDRIIASSDFNGDGIDDIALQNQYTGDVKLWIIEQGNVSREIELGQVDPVNFKNLTDVGDNFNRPSIFLEKNNFDKLFSWSFDEVRNNDVPATRTFVDAPSLAGWTAVDTVDFDRDGDQDILARNYITSENRVFLLEDEASVGEVALGQNFQIQDSDWELATAGNFDADTDIELLWRHQVTGAIATWDISASLDDPATSFVDLAVLGLGADGVLSDLNWEIATAADIDGDGRDNILWRNKVTGQNAAWDLEGSILKTASFLESLDALDWHLVDAVDADGDSDSDLIWRNVVTGQSAVWRMEQQGDSFTKQESYFLPTLGDLSWQVV